MKKTVASIVAETLCVGCGVCAASCPMNCIRMKKNENGYLEPEIDNDLCILCGKCFYVCSSQEDTCYDENNINLDNSTQAYSAYIKDKEIRLNATSGGVVTGLIEELLQNGEYDDALIVQWKEVSEIAETMGYKSVVMRSSTQKSKYLPVSHYYTAKRMKDNPREKLIIVATPCTIKTLKKYIFQNSLQVNNYLFIGLFCDGTMSYNFLDYFQTTVCKKRMINQFEFRSKEMSGWPGDVKIIFKDGMTRYINRKERMLCKPFFKLERCAYCTMKLGMCADISVGDDYIRGEESNDGVSSVLIHSKLGRLIWEKYKDAFEWHAVEINDVLQSQKVQAKKKNVINWKLRNKTIQKCVCVDRIKYIMGKMFRMLGKKRKYFMIKFMISLKRIL